MLPRSALELYQLVQSRDVDVTRVTRLMEFDAFLAGHVLRRANTAWYARGAPARSLRGAVVRMGLTTTANVFLELAASTRLFTAPGYAETMEALRRHSVVVAHFAAVVAHHAETHQNVAFMAGLLHDIGIAASFVALAEDGCGSPPPVDDVYASVIAIHEDAGAAVAQLWGLPIDVQHAISFHHLASSHRIRGPLVAILTIAEALAVERGVGMVEPMGDPTQGYAALGLEARVDAIAADADAVLERL